MIEGCWRRGASISVIAAVVLAGCGLARHVAQPQPASATIQSLTSASWVYVSRDGGRHWR
jgi:hypothetical protein